MQEKMTLEMQLFADANRLESGMRKGGRSVNQFAATAKRGLNSVKRTLSSLEGRIAAFGVGFSAVDNIMSSARMDKKLIQVRQTAGAAKDKVAGLRSEFFRMATLTGQSVDDLRAGFDNAVQAGLNFKEATPVIGAVNYAMAVTSASADKLTSSLTVASTAFDFDLAKPGKALHLLDKMTVAGQLGNAELENLSDIFGRVGPNAASANLGFSQTLAFIEGLSQIERQPERLATLADSTLRLFNNLNYMKEAQKATRVRFFNPDGSRRDALKVIADIKKIYDKLDTEAKRASFMQKAFGKADQDTIKGMRLLMTGGMLNDINAFTKKIGDAGGYLEDNLDDALNNAVDQTGRLKGGLREAADGFAQPINDSVTKAIKYTLDSKANGGLGMDGKDIMLAGGATVAGGLVLSKLGGKLMGGLAKRLGVGVATGKALEETTGIQPVYVVNMPDGMGGMDGKKKPGAGSKGKASRFRARAGTFGTAAAGTTSAFALKNAKATTSLLFGSNMKALRMMGPGAMTTAGGVGTAALGTGYALGHTDLGGKIALHIMKFFGSKDAKMALDSIKAEAELKGSLHVRVDSQGRASATLSTNQPGLKITMDNGPLLVGD